MSKNLFAILMALCFVTSGCIGNEEVDIFYGEDISPSMPAEDFTLTDEEGNEFNFYDYEAVSYTHLTLPTKRIV